MKNHSINLVVGVIIIVAITLHLYLYERMKIYGWILIYILKTKEKKIGSTIYYFHHEAILSKDTKKSQ